MELTEGLVAVLGRIGESDCETLGTGLLAQPVNTVTSGGYVLVGIGVVAGAVRSRFELTRSIVFGCCLAAIGLGSVMFHGPQTAGSHLMHDLPIVLTALFIVNHDLWLLRTDRRHEFGTLAVASVVATIVAVVNVDLVAGLTGITVGCAALTEWIVYRRGRRSFELARQRRAYLAIVIVGALAGASWLLGRTDGPLCEPESIVQLHGLWHLISAVIFGLWWRLALAERPVAAAASRGRPESPDQLGARS